MSVTDRPIQSCPVIAETPTDAAHFFGFHDLCPWDAANEQLAILRVDPGLRRVPNGDDVAELCLWEPAAGRVTPIAETRAWNWQQGARQQWLPGGGRRLAYNALVSGELVGVVLEVDSGNAMTLPFTVAAVSPDGRTSLSPHFARLARHWPAYGYSGAAAPGIDDPSPDSDGLWRMDLATAKVDLVVSIAEAAALGGGKPPPGTFHFLTHPSFSPSGSRMCFLHRYFTADRALYSRLIVGRPDGTGLAVVAEEKVSHFDWRDDDTILVWTRSVPSGLALARRSGLLAAAPIMPIVRLARKLRPGLKQMLLAESYVLIDVTAPAHKTPVGKGVLEQDGHPMYTADRRWILTDTYPDSERMQTLILYETGTGRRIDIGRFRSDPSVYDSDIKCDLHPRWDRSERLICVDSTDRGVRQCLIIDAAAVVGAYGATHQTGRPERPATPARV